MTTSGTWWWLAHPTGLWWYMRQKTLVKHCTGGLSCTAFQRLLQSSVTRLGLRLIRSGGHSPRVFQTLHNLSDTVSWTITMLSLAWKHKKEENLRYRSSVSSPLLPPPSSILHASFSQILQCNKAEIKRLAVQLNHNEIWRVSFA